MLRKLSMRLCALLHKAKMERELDEEMRNHVEQQTEQNIRLGMNPDEARYAARRAFGGVEQAKERSRDTRGVRWLEELWQDLRYGGRILLKNPGFTLVAVITLALGIGAKTAIFSIVNAILLRSPTGVSEPEQLVQVGWTRNNFKIISGLRYPDYCDYRDQNTVFSGLAIMGSLPIHLSTGSDAERVTGALVSGNYFNVLGMKVRLGRTLMPEDDTASGANPVAVISNPLWERRFGSDHNIVGKTINLNGHPFTIVGVAAKGFTGTIVGITVDMWIPITMYSYAEPAWRDVSTVLTNRGSHFLNTTFGRLKQNVSGEQAQAEMSMLARRREETYPKTNSGVGVTVVPGLGLGPEQRSDVRQFAAWLMAIVGLVLIVASAIIANVLLARAISRRKEFGVRLALGASRIRLIRQLLTESLLLASLGGFAGVCLAVWMNESLLKLIPKEHKFPAPADLNMDWRVLGFTLLVTLITGIFFGLIPALHASKPDLLPMLKDSALSGYKGKRLNLRGALIIGQTALTLLVLVCAGLFVRTLQNLQMISPGFNTEQVMVGSFDLGRQGYSEAQVELFYRQIIERIEALPGIHSASLAVWVPLTGTQNSGIRVEGQEGNSIQVDDNVIASHYFETMDIPLVLGRDFNQADDKTAPGVVIINESFARRAFPQQNPLGRRIAFRTGSTTYGLSLEIIGVARDIKHVSLLEPSRPHVYKPLFQNYRQGMTLHVRAAGNPSVQIAAVRREVQNLDKNLPVFGVKTLAEQLRDLLLPQRSLATLIGFFGLLTLSLVSIGLYGVMSYLVTERTYEIGIRIALGARRTDALLLVLRQGIMLVVFGTVIGLAVTLAITRILSSALYGVSANDALTYTGASLLIIFTALLACSIPARRATKVDPMVALRCE